MHLAEQLREQTSREAQRRLQESIAPALAAINDTKRVKARQQLACTLPKGTLLPDRGSAATVLDLMQHGATATFVPCGSLGIRLFFAKSSDEERMWHVSGALLRRYDEEHFCLIASDGSGQRLDLYYKDGVAKRISRGERNGQRVELRRTTYCGIRLA